MKVTSTYKAPDGNGNVFYVENPDGTSADVKCLDDTGLMYVMDPHHDIDETQAMLAATAYTDSNIDDAVYGDETEYGEPRYWLYLKNGRSIEVCHEENGLPEDRQYWSFRLHCSDAEFEQDKYESTLGVIAQRFSDKPASLNSRIIIQKLARIA